MAHLRPAAVAGSWYPGTAEALERAVHAQLSEVRSDDGDEFDELAAVIAPHAGLMYSGPVAAYAYAAVRRQAFDVMVLVGPSHFIRFDGVAVYSTGGFQTPLGPIWVDEPCAAALMKAAPGVREVPVVHKREHSLEMQLPFIQCVAPGVRIVPLLMGDQSAEAARALSEGLIASLPGRRALLVASTDLSHYHDAEAAARLDGIVTDCVARFDTDGLQRALTERPDHACGAGPMVAVMQAARALGARDAAVLKYADSGDVSGDKSAVVGYMAAALGMRRGTARRDDV